MKNRYLAGLVCAGFLLSACAAPSTNPPPDRNNQATGEMCGGIAGFTCGNPNDFCKIPIGSQCGAADQSGTCTTKPQVCTMDFNPVCGCDGQTYGNACAAAGAGVSVATLGECGA